MGARLRTPETRDRHRAGAGEPSALVQGDARSGHPSRRLADGNGSNAPQVSGFEPGSAASGAGAIGSAKTTGAAPYCIVVRDRTDPAPRLSQRGQPLSGACVLPAAGDGATT